MTGNDRVVEHPDVLWGFSAFGVVQIYLCKEHYMQLKQKGVVQDSHRVKGILTISYCTVPECTQHTTWSATIRLQKEKQKRRD